MFRVLKKLPDEFTVWHRTARSDGPQFLALWRGRHAFLIQVAATTQELAETALQPVLLPGEETLTPDSLGEAERAALESFLPDPFPPGLPVRRLVVFPNVASATIDRVRQLRSANTGSVFLGLKQTPENQFADWLERSAAEALEQEELIALRKHFSPESVVRGSQIRVPLNKRGNAAPLPPAFLDFEQESLTKLDVELPPVAERLARSTESRLVTGPAGCGKSLVLLHRALLAARLHRGARLLVLTHNRPINSELRRRALATAPEGSRIQWLTFFQWTARHLDNGSRIISAREVKKRIDTLSTSQFGLGKLTTGFLAEEIGYIRDLGVETRDDYLALDRSGRLAGLTRNRRNAVWTLLERYRDDLHKRNETDWHERALEFRRFASSHPERFMQRDFIFVDEAQFFAKIWFAPILAALAPGGQLFLAADPTQGFLKRRESWLAAGIDVRGRANRLDKPYRSTRRILEFATRLLELRRAVHPGAATDDLDPPGSDDLASVEETGETPHILDAASGQDAISLAAQEIAALRRRAPWLAGSVLALHADSFATGALSAALRRSLGPGQVADLNDWKHDNPPKPFCSISNLNAATGLEAAVVFLLGLDDLLDAEADPRLDPEARDELAAAHTRLIYMACTRAARRLVVITRSAALNRVLEAAVSSSRMDSR